MAITLKQYGIVINSHTGRKDIIKQLNLSTTYTRDT